MMLSFRRSMMRKKTMMKRRILRMTRWRKEEEDAGDGLFGC